MPELPEVETLKETLSRLIVGKQIAGVEVRLPRLIRQPSVPDFKRYFVGCTLSQIERRGKYLMLQAFPYTLVMHMRMEGKLSLHCTGEPEEKHVHVVFRFTDGTELRYRDIRQFGTLDLIPYGEYRRVSGLCDLGPEPLEEAFTPEVLKAQLMKHPKRMVKAALLDQRVVAGLGNIYADEALFGARIHPVCKIFTLKSHHYATLHASIKDVLQRGVAAGGASVRSYLNGQGEMGYFQLQICVYGKAGEPCPRCGRAIQRIVVAGRGTHLCTNCQRKRRI